MDNENKLISKKEAAKMLSSSERTIDRLISAGKLKKIKVLRSVKVQLKQVLKIVEQGC